MCLITLSALFLFASTMLAALLDLSSRQDDKHFSLSLHDGIADTRATIGITAHSDFDDENWLERQITSAKKIANKATHKQCKTAAKAEVEKARQNAMIKSNRGLGKKTAKTPCWCSSCPCSGKHSSPKREERTEDCCTG